MKAPGSAALLLALATAPAARAEYILFDSTTDTIDVSGQTVIGTASTYEAVVMLPSGTGAAGRIFNEWTNFLEDKYLYVGPDQVGGFNFSSPCCPAATGLALAPDVFHHVAYVLDGAAGEERLYLDGALVGSRATASFDVGDGDGPARIGAIFRDGVVAPSFIGYLDSVRLSDVARYSGASFTAPTGDMTSDANTLLLYNFDEAPGSSTVADSGPLGRTGTLGQGFEAATPPTTGADPSGGPAGLEHFLCYKTKPTKGDICSAASAQNAGAACEAEEDCGGNAETDFCVANKLPKTTASLTDPQSEGGRQVDIKKGAALCVPANKNNEGIENPDDHLRSFSIKTAKAQPPFPTSDAVPVSNQFGPVVLVASKVDRLLVPAFKDPKAPVPAPQKPLIDHFRCQKVKVAKDSSFAAISQVSVVDQFQQPKLFDLKKPTRLCTAVNKNGEGLVDPGALLLCYQAKAGPGQPKHVKLSGLHVAHQFGVERLDTVKEEELCVPSVRPD